ncbi:class I SAM-dependent methyltransferase [uncultured Pseudodesulfovibrio sp.]|uniref:class I SAM-dependent methyltransferase n=1 Tax=uncultured Pseudodesulfovibrio sp. TaxID=2035858 RepID=UPI0029C8A58F|nr:class I SAM-dependent methyltransferase [uncultured Pseudodesulfovibrio sp.]
MTTTIFIPVEEYAELLLKIKTANLPIRKAKPCREVDLTSLQCVLLSFEGVDTTTRTPFAYPFITTLLRGEFRQPLYYLEDVDWIFLGGDKDTFVNLLDQHLVATKGDITPVPFQSLTNTVPQTPVVGEYHVTIPRNTKNYNENDWSQKKEIFKETQPSDWNQKFKANTNSFEHLVTKFAAPHLQRSPEVIVDLGCGLGKTTYGLAKEYPDAQVFGLELSDSALEVAINSFTAPNLKFLKHDISSPLLFDEGSIDLLISINALAYAKNQRNSANDIFRKLSPDGIFFNHSRIGYSHDFWEFPYSLVWPIIFQIYPETWAESAQENGYNTHMLPPQLSRRLTPWSFAHPRSEKTCTALDQCSLRLQEHEVNEYQPCITHALMLHSRHVEDNMEHHVCSGKTRSDVLNHCLTSLDTMPDFVQETSLASRRENVETLQLNPIGIDYCKRIVHCDVPF